MIFGTFAMELSWTPVFLVFGKDITTTMKIIKPLFAPPARILSKLPSQPLTLKIVMIGCKFLTGILLRRPAEADD